MWGYLKPEHNYFASHSNTGTQLAEKKATTLLPIFQLPTLKKISPRL